MKDNGRNFMDDLDKDVDELLAALDLDDAMDVIDDTPDDTDAPDDPDVFDDSNIIILNDENGNEIPFEFLDLIEYRGAEYVVLLPADDEEDAEEVIILRFDGNPDNPEEESYSSVDDDETLQAVFRIFKEKFKDEFNFVD